MKNFDAVKRAYKVRVWNNGTEYLSYDYTYDKF